MIEFQEKWYPVVPGLHFVIGFSGKFFQGSENKMENEGDQYILGRFSLGYIPAKSHCDHHNR